MTRDQIRELYGKPKTVTTTATGETWRYNNYDMALIPFNFGWRPKAHSFTFNPEGKLTEFSVDE